MNARTLVSSLIILAVAPTAALSQMDMTPLQEAVAAAERGFAKTMADRDIEAFATFVSEEAVFMDGMTASRGRAAVVEHWTPLFEGENAPFSWEPEVVQVLESGTLALSSGPVYTPDGKRAGTYNSTWRLESDGKWRVVFDKGCP